MKKIISFLVFIILFGTGCTKFLTLNPKDSFSPSTYFETSDELELWTNQFYTMFSGADDLVGQNADDNADNIFGRLMEGQRDPTNVGGWDWTRLRKINYYLAHSSNCKDEDARKHYDGVAYFFRALFYFQKVRMFGNVPWYDQVIASSDDALLFKPRDDRELVMDSVLADLDKAIALLPEVQNSVKVTKWTALALKTRIALFEGTFREYHGLNNYEKYLNEVVQAGETFMNESSYTLYNVGPHPYRDLFDSDIATDPASGVILARVYSSEANLMTSIQFDYLNNKKGLTRNFINHYLMDDGSRIEDQPGWEAMTFVQQTKDRDPRLSQTVLTPGYIQKGGISETVNTMRSSTGFQPIKFVSSSAYDGSNKGVNDYPLFRTAEVYLNYAEAKAELGTITQQGLDNSVNKIRKRVNMPGIDLARANADPDSLLEAYYSHVTKNEFTGIILEIRRERTVELVLEGFRQWDLLRWDEGKLFGGPFEGIYFPGPGQYDMDGDGDPDVALWKGTKVTIPDGVSLEIGDDITLSEGDSGYVVAFPYFSLEWNEDRDYLWPIPKDQILLSKGKLKQNPNWEQ